jgi:phospholipid transport system substrate-binding protein
MSLAALAAALLLAPPARAGEATDLVRARQSKAIAVLKADRQPSAARDARVSAILLSLFDFPALARATLSEEEWKKHPGDEQKEFTGLLTRLVQRSLERSLAQVTDFTIEYLAEEDRGGALLVRTRATRPGGKTEPLDITYEMRKGVAGFRAVDVAVGEHSTVENYRKQFARVLAREGWPALLARMRNKLDKSDS